MNIDLYRTPYLQTLNPYSYYTSLNTPGLPLDPLQKPPTLLQTIMDLLTAFTDYYKTSSTCYILYSIADISKQVSKG